MSCITPSSSSASSGPLGDFSIGVAVHPEPHPRSPSIESDRRHSAEKLAEADFAITQFFFEAHHYFDLVDVTARAWRRQAGDPGDHAGADASAASSAWRRCRAPSSRSGSREKLRAVEDDPGAVRTIGIDEATKLCRALLDGGAPGLHFYTLNRSTATREIYANLGL